MYNSMIKTMPKKSFLLLVFITLSAFSFAQSIKIIGVIPPPDTGKVYQLQIGAFRLAGNVKTAEETLRKNGFVPQREKAGDLVRVFIAANANEVRAAVDRLCRAGFKEVIIREYAAGQVKMPVEPRSVNPKPVEVPYKPEDFEVKGDTTRPPVFETEDPEHDLMHLY